MTDRNKIIERVRKLLAMAGDAGSPHEATIAAGRARKLMDQHQLSQKDFAEKSKYGTTQTGKARLKWPKWESTLAVCVAELNDCLVRFARTGDGTKVLLYQGEESDTLICNYLFIYLTESAKRLYRQHTKQADSAGRGAAETFKSAFACAVYARVKEMIKERAAQYRSSGTDLMLVKKQMVEQHFGKARYKERTATHTAAHHAAYQAGRDAGNRIGIHTGVTGTQRTGLNAN